MLIRDGANLSERGCSHPLIERYQRIVGGGFVFPPL